MDETHLVEPARRQARVAAERESHRRLDRLSGGGVRAVVAAKVHLHAIEGHSNSNQQVIRRSSGDHQQVISRSSAGHQIANDR